MAVCKGGQGCSEQPILDLMLNGGHVRYHCSCCPRECLWHQDGQKYDPIELIVLAPLHVVVSWQHRSPLLMGRCACITFELHNCYYCCYYCYYYYCCCYLVGYYDHYGGPPLSSPSSAVTVHFSIGKGLSFNCSRKLALSDN